VILAMGPPGSDASNELKAVHTMEQELKAKTNPPLVTTDFGEG
jgi:hypothetical protein